MVSPQQSAALSQFLCTGTGKQKTIITHAHKPFGQYMQQKAAHKLCRRQNHLFLLAIVVIMVAECDMSIAEIQDAMIANCNSIHITSKIV